LALAAFVLMMPFAGAVMLSQRGHDLLAESATVSAY
jgi:hypothetical protein